MKKLLKNFFLAFVPYTVVGVIVGLILGVEILHVVAIIAAMIIVNMAVNILTELSKDAYRLKIQRLRDATAKQK